MSRDELIALVGRQDGQITAMAGQIADLIESNEALAAKLARLEHLLSRNSGNSSSPPSRDGDPGRTPPEDKRRRRGGPTRPKGKQRGAPGANLAWTDTPDERTDRFPEGRCECGHDLADASDLGVVNWRSGVERLRSVVSRSRSPRGPTYRHRRSPGSCAAHGRQDPTPPGSHSGSQSPGIVDVHGRPHQVGDLLKHSGRSGLNCRSQTSKAREGSRAGAGSNPTATAN